MFYRKNIYAWEQALRIIISAAIVIYAFYAMSESMLSYAIIGMAVGFGLTGVVGFCPMCAMVGRKIKTTGE